jgi:hypothetical protein
LLLGFPALEKRRDGTFAAGAAQGFADAVDSGIFACPYQLGGGLGDMRIQNTGTGHSVFLK